MSEGPLPPFSPSPFSTSGEPPKGYFSDSNPYVAPATPYYAAPNRGMIGHLPVAASLTLVSAIFEMLFAGMFLFASIMFSTMTFPVRPGEPTPPREMMVGMFAVWTVVIAIACVCHFIAAIGMFQMRWRMTCIVMQAIGLLGIATMYCAPTAIGFAIYSLLVLLNEPVAWAFRRVADGTPWPTIQNGMPPGATN